MKISLIKVMRSELDTATNVAQFWSNLQEESAASDCRPEFLRARYEDGINAIALLLLDCHNPHLTETIVHSQKWEVLREYHQQLEQMGYTFERFENGVFARAV